MFRLGTSTLPLTRDQFISALEGGLRLFGPAPRVVDATGESYPRLDRLRIDLTGGHLTKQARPSMGVGRRQPAVTVADFAVSGDPMLWEGSPAHLRIIGTDVRFEYDEDSTGHPVLLLAGLQQGEIEVRIERAELESALLTIARAEAGRHGVQVDRISVALHSRGPQAMDFEATVTAGKLFMKTDVVVSGHLEIDDSLIARLSGLRCDGSGMMGNLACNFIRPHLHRFEEQPISLMALPLGDARLTGLTMDGGNSLRLHATLAGR